jgi:hypothetical protein
MDMVTPPLVIDLPTEVAAEVDERDRGLLGEDEAVVGMCLMIKTPL